MIQITSNCSEGRPYQRSTTRQLRLLHRQNSHSRAETLVQRIRAIPRCESNTDAFRARRLRVSPTVTVECPLSLLKRRRRLRGCGASLPRMVIARIGLKYPSSGRCYAPPAFSRSRLLPLWVCPLTQHPSRRACVLNAQKYGGQNLLRVSDRYMRHAVNLRHQLHALLWNASGALRVDRLAQFPVAETNNDRTGWQLNVH